MFPVVAIGASAGGLDALRLLFSHLDAKSGMAFVVIQHLDPERPSMLAEALKTVTRLPVVEVTSGMPLEPDRVHVIPSASDLTVQRGILALMPRQRTGRLHLPIDGFFRSLAQDGKARAIGVVLSGSGADGTEGLRAIKAEGGITIAQEPDSARCPSMPASAITAGVVDFRGSPEFIAVELARLGRHPYVATGERAVGEPQEPSAEQEANLAPIFAALRRRVGVDFSGYKRTTVSRRIQRRMALRRVVGLAAYAGLLQEDPGEARALANDMLIHVTSFFRDSDAFDALGEQVFKRLVERKGADGTIRIWVPGCATGEEAYAVVMCLLESLDPGDDTSFVKLFGTDLSDESVETARLAVYSDSALAGVSPGRLARFFERVDGGYRIARSVRDLCVFVKHDLTRDPPFAKLDLISCRNLLIYFDSELQRRVIPMLHYCLNPQGYLFLGQSEAITEFRDLFTPVVTEHRIFVKRGDSLRFAHALPAGREAEVTMAETRPPERRQCVREAQRQADHLLLARYAPPGVIVNDRFEIIQFRGRTGVFLEPAPGQPQSNVLRMTREGLVAHVYEAVGRAKVTGEAVRRHGLQVPLGPEIRIVDLEVTPLAAATDSSERYFLILFAEAARPGAEVARSVESERPTTDTAAEAALTKSDLVATRDYLQWLIAEHQSTMDDLAAANEEFVAGNEELQSTNEELQSAKEELQSTNEELSTVNDQLRNRNLELDQIANDLVNILSSVEIPVIIVDLELRVRRFTPTASAIASFIPQDVGRPINDLKLKVQVDDLAGKIQDVVDGLSAKEWEVQGRDGRWFRLQIRPYRTSDNRLDGALLSFVDVDALRRAIEDAERARDYARSIVETVTVALVVLDTGLHVVSANESFYAMFATTARAAEGKSLSEFSGQLWEEPVLRQALDEAFSDRKQFTAIDLTTELPHLGPRIFSFNGRPLLSGGAAELVLVTIDDVTGLRSLEAERSQLLMSEKRARLEAERATRAKDLFLATLSHELRQPLSSILISAQLLGKMASQNSAIERASASIERAAKSQARLIDDLLDVSRIISGKLLLDLGPVNFAAVVHEAVDFARPSAHAKGLALQVLIVGTIGPVYGDPARLLQVVSNLLGNAIKFTPHGGRIRVRLAYADEGAQLTIADNGIGIPADVVPRLFDRFVQADSSVTRTYGGLGLGLSIVRHLIEVHGGEVRAESPGEGSGATFYVTLPLGNVAVPKSAAPSRAVGRGIDGVRVLLVEDDDDTRDTCAAMLAELGATVRAVPSAAAGLLALDRFQPQVILSDIAMPGEDGYSFIEKVRHREPERGGRVPAAALTALANDEDRQRAIRSGFQTHVAKPVDVVQLSAVVRKLADENLVEARAKSLDDRPGPPD